MMGGGPDGATNILRTEIERTGRLLGVNAVEELNPGHVILLERLAPRPGG